VPLPTKRSPRHRVRSRACRDATCDENSLRRYRRSRTITSVADGDGIGDLRTNCSREIYFAFLNFRGSQPLLFLVGSTFGDSSARRFFCNLVRP
jgi:hypothetical protein